MIPTAYFFSKKTKREVEKAFANENTKAESTTSESSKKFARKNTTTMSLTSTMRMIWKRAWLKERRNR
jgi:hypothetical protein